MRMQYAFPCIYFLTQEFSGILVALQSKANGSRRNQCCIDTGAGGHHVANCRSATIDQQCSHDLTHTGKNFFRRTGITLFTHKTSELMVCTNNAKICFRLMSRHRSNLNYFFNLSIFRTTISVRAD